MLPRLARRTLIVIAALAATSAARPVLAAWPHDPTVNVPIAPSSTPNYPRAIVADGAGGAIIVWADSRSGNLDIYAQHLTATGAVAPGWPAGGLAICTASGDQDQAQAAPDGAGGALITWVDGRLPLNGDIYAMRVNGNGTFPAGWPANGRLLYANSTDESSPAIVGDGAGGALVAWVYNFSLSDRDIYGAHVDANGNLLWATWLYQPLGIQQHPSVVSDGVGGMVVGFEDFLSGNEDIRALRCAGNGSILWGPVTLCGAAGDQSNSVAASDGGGGIIMAWQDPRSGQADIYASRVTISGARPTGWTFDGNPICTATDAQVGPRMVSDGGGGAIITWIDWRNGSDPDVYASRILSGGGMAFGWPSNGLLICGAATAQFVRDLASDGAGGAIIAWEDSRYDGFCDVFVSRAAANGGLPPGWVYGGTPLSMAGGQQSLPLLCGDGQGGAIATWSDNRSGSSQVFAQNVDLFGQLGDARPGIVSIKDVKADQGGHVRMVWNASYLDVNPLYAVSSYWIWRQTPAAAAAAAVKSGAAWIDGPSAALSVAGEAGAPAPTRLFRHAEDATSGFAWEYLASQPANASPQYSYVAPTVSDSVTGYNPYTVFMVEARGTAVGAFWDSPADSGYSVDNLPPLTPAPFTGNYSAGATHLHWGPNLEADFANYRLYRGSSAGFVPGPSNLMAAPPDTGYADAGNAGSYYKLSAVDAHGNESGFALLSPSGTVDVSGAPPLVLALARPAPNPAREAPRLVFTLPHETHVRLAIYDVAGRVERELVQGVLPAGEHASTWDLRDGSGAAAHSGLYFVRMEAEGRHFIQRLVVTQ